MAAKRVNPRLVKKNLPYTVGELAAVLSVHKNTILNWTNKGLSPVDGCKPMMFRGRDVIEWLLARRGRARHRCPPGTMFCFKCREARKPALALVDYREINSSSGNMQGLCEQCETVMNRRVSRDRISVVMPGIEVQFPQAP